nr:MAG TPA: hypothetical protein [Caudoviricetes sp.]
MEVPVVIQEIDSKVLEPYIIILMHLMYCLISIIILKLMKKY